MRRTWKKTTSYFLLNNVQHKNFSKETVGRTHQKFRKRDPIFPHSLCVIMVQCIVYLSIVLYSLRVCTVSVN